MAAGGPAGMGGLEGLLGALGGGGGLDGIWDNPMIANIAFHPSPAQPTHLGKTEGPIRDGTFNVGDGEKVAYRLYLPPDASATKAVVYFFHGNAEVCTAMDDFAEFFHAHGAGLLSIDYRGYAWGTGQPSLTKLCSDTDLCYAESEKLFASAGVAGAKRIAYGRSIGATCAVHLAANFGKIEGLIVDSGLMSIKTLPMVSMMAPMVFGQNPQAFQNLKEPFDTLGKLTRVACPCLVMHGDRDEIVPYQQGVDCHGRIPAAQKTLKTWAGAGHNDVLLRYASEWQKAVVELFGQVAEYSNPFPIGTSVESHSLSTESMNGQKGKVLGPQGERIRVEFPDPIGEKALKPANLKVLAQA